MKERRSPEEIARLVAQARRMIAGGASANKAAEQVGLAESVLRSHLKKGTGTTGSVNVASLPPRPSKRGGYRKPKRINLDDVGEVAHRISKIDRKVARFKVEGESLLREREGLAKRLIALLK